MSGFFKILGDIGLAIGKELFSPSSSMRDIRKKAVKQNRQDIIDKIDEQEEARKMMYSKVVDIQNNRKQGE